MSHSGTLLLVAALTSGLATGAGAQPLAAARAVTLTNGLTLLLAPDTTATSVDVAVWHPAGLAIEPAGKSGITHLVEHLMFRGSSHVAALDHVRRIEATGGTANAVTTADYTCTWETVPPDALPLVFELEADRLGALAPTTEAIEAEKRVIAQEREAAASAPLARGLEQLYLAAYPDHSYRHPVIGSPDDVAQLTLADCQAWYHDHYGPEHAIVTVVGRFDPDQAIALARERLQPLPRRTQGSTPPAALPTPAGPRHARARGTLPVPVIAAGWRGPSGESPDALPLALLARMAGGRGGTPLDMALVGPDKELLLLQSGFDGRGAGTLFYTVAAVRAGADSTAVEHDLVAAVERLATEPPTADALERARREEEAGTLFAWQTSRHRAEALGGAVMLGGSPASAAARLDRLRALTPEDIQHAAQRLLVPAARTVVWLTAAPAQQGGR